MQSVVVEVSSGEEEDVGESRPSRSFAFQVGDSSPLPVGEAKGCARGGVICGAGGVWRA